MFENDEISKDSIQTVVLSQYDLSLAVGGILSTNSLIWMFFILLFLQSLEYQLQQSQKLSEMYREQVIQLEDELSRIREEGDVTREIFKVISHSILNSIISIISLVIGFS